jgi:Ca-activated chloride channel family protein
VIRFRAIALVIAASTATVDGQVFRVAVDGVAVDVLVTRDKRPVAGLTTADFTLRDNGVEQRIESVMLEDVPITLLLALDTSASMQGKLLEQLKAAAKAAAGALRPIDRVGLLVFNNGVRLLVAPPAEASALAAHLDTLEAHGDTSVFDATFAALTIRERAPGRTLVLVFSDGDDTSSWLDPRDVIATAQRSDVVVHAVALDNSYGTGMAALNRLEVARRLFPEEPHLFGSAYLWHLVQDTGGALHEATADGLRDAFVRVVNEFRSRYVLTYVPEGVAPRGWHGIEVDVKSRRAKVTARRGYLR